MQETSIFVVYIILVERHERGP